MKAVRQRRRRKTFVVWGRRWSMIYGYRSGEWWIGARRNYAMDVIEWNASGLAMGVIEWNAFGLTIMVGRA